jgi:threonine dehydratase
MTDISMIEAARGRIGNHAVRTPLLSSPFLDEIAGRKLFVKAECLQRTGSFKFRGGWSAVSGLPAEVRAKGVIAFSSGNHAQGVALAARLHNVPAVIIMPSDAPKIKIDNTRAFGAEVVLYDRANEDRDAIGDRISRERGLTLIRPYDEPLVIAGQGTVGLEIAEQGAELGIGAAEVLVPCGGGGLTSGISLALAAKAPSGRRNRSGSTMWRAPLLRVRSSVTPRPRARSATRSSRRSPATLLSPSWSGSAEKALP